MIEHLRHASRVTAGCLALALFTSGSVCAAPAKPTAGEVKVDATGTAETREGALIDACRLAVAKVHGSRVIGRMANQDFSGLKLDAAGKKGSEKSSVALNARTYDIADNTAMSFDGLLLRYEVKKEDKNREGRWSVHILADVLNALPDKFAGRQAVVLPSLERITKSLSSGNAGPKMVGEVAQELSRVLASTFSNHPQFVLLERESEDVLNEELSRAASGNSAVKEQSKLKSEKTADIVVEVKSEPLEVRVNTTRFESTPPLQKVQIRLSGSIRLLDVATKGEICRTPFEAGNLKPVTSAGDENAAVMKALGEFKASLNGSLRAAKCDLLAKLGVTNLVAGPSGAWVVGGGLDAQLLQTGDTISLWRGEGASLSKIGESTITVESSGVFLDNKAFKATQGEVFSFRMDSVQTRFSNSVPAGFKEGEAPASTKPSLKERLKFD
jgi:hypothetical protein